MPITTPKISPKTNKHICRYLNEISVLIPLTVHQTTENVMPKATQACYWIIGINTDRPAIAVDLHTADGSLANPNNETWTMSLDRADQAEEAALIYAAEHGIGPLDVSFDEDSTAFYAKA